MSVRSEHAEQVAAEQIAAAKDPEAQELPPAAEKRRERHFWVRAAVVAALGVVIVTLLGSALLSISHAPTPHHVPLAYVGADNTRMALASQAGDALDIRTYGSRDAAVTAIGRLDVYGALVIGGTGVELLKSTAASPQVATILTGLVTTAFAPAGAPTITEVSPLPSSDSGGGSIGVMLQVIILGGTIGALGLGQLVPRYRANVARGELPILFLILYGLCLGAGVAGLARAFGVGSHIPFMELTASLALINLAVTASISAIVSIIGAAGAAVGGVLYFLLGAPISGAATAAPLMPAFWHGLGQALPPGAGATLLRRVVYFPDAPLGTPILTLALYAGLGAVVLGIVNAVAGAQRRKSLTGLP
ncbi:hypothetical protein [Paractinoplanes atraurantiacus]|uniref:ABC-2 family transporter protein n=1 Tax=Paractinoplanes atraurantiacus TaxID=1036182 RepID=A0A285GKI0_9ACTN|nr:hypothetical protein [Actinoplanes atraurantiacus]SNY24130.1 hypothetical protein SAMN05421748_102141 [Actinoplanes atraurantiacus]